MSRRKTSTCVALAAITLLALSDIQIYTNEPTPPAASPGPMIVINEVDSDTPSTDVAEFVELYDGGTGNTPLDGYVVVFYNGGNDLSYQSFDLDGFTTSAGGYFTLGNSGVAGVDLVFSNSTLQNGPDAVALFLGNATDFPSGTAVTTANLEDALVYHNGTTVDTGLLPLLNSGQAQINENGTAAGATMSMQRIPNGTGGGRNTDTYQVLAPTPDGPNLIPSAAAVSLSGRVSDSLGRGIRGATITIGGGGPSTPRVGISSSFGYFGFDDLLTGTYVVTIYSKRHVFAISTRVVTLNDNTDNFDFIAEPEE